ncbi:MAG: AmmeMemoRadiSam system protein B [Elusimicrobia bacterium]|nr:AmmeMemoRadiSam system protein B [Candidatus Obscuribacterium magneticum]
MKTIRHSGESPPRRVRPLADRNPAHFVTPAKAGGQDVNTGLDPGFRRGDEKAWFPAFTGMTTLAVLFTLLTPSFSQESSPLILSDTWANWEKRFARAFEDMVPRKIPGRAMGIIVPGDTRYDLLPLSAFGYELIARDRFETALIILPAPAGASFNGLCTTALPQLEAAVGSFAVDLALSQQLQAMDFPVTVDDSLFQPKVPDLLETQLAALKFVLKFKTRELRVLPLLVKFSDVNSQVKDYAPALAEKIKDLGIEGDVIVIVAGNLTRASSEPALVQADKVLLSSIRNLDVDSLIDLQKNPPVKDATIETPDVGSLSMGLLALKWLGADHAEILGYAHSGQMVLTKNKSAPLSYVAAGFSSDPPYPPKLPHVEREKMVSIFGELFRTDILTVTRQTCASILDPTAAKPPALMNREAAKKWPLYVSLYDPKGALAGQIGTHVAVGPLEESLRRFSVDAVKQAQPNLTKDNFSTYVVDVSIPYGFNKIEQPDELVPFLNGVIVYGERKSSAVHPDAWRLYADPHQLLGHICFKLGMVPWSYATRAAKMESFRVLAFNEKEPFQDLSGVGKKKKKGRGGEEEEAPTDTGGGGGLFPF